jgi:hypothetical protein
LIIKKSTRQKLEEFSIKHRLGPDVMSDLLVIVEENSKRSKIEALQSQRILPPSTPNLPVLANITDPIVLISDFNDISDNNQISQEKEKTSSELNQNNPKKPKRKRNAGLIDFKERTKVKGLLPIDRLETIVAMEKEIPVDNQGKMPSNPFEPSSLRT